MVRKYNKLSSRLRKPGYGKYSYSGTGNHGWINEIFNDFRVRLSNYRTIILGAVVGIFIAFTAIIISDFFRVKALASFQPNITTKIYDKNDKIIAELFRQKREVVPWKKIPKEVVNAFIAVEDREFYEHFGINPKGIVRALFINIFSGSIKQGGSTITQQLSKIMLTSRKRNLYRKAKEAFIAIMMEMFYTKDEIMEMYLNQLFLGHGTYGVESASRFYFDKHVWELNVAEAALLATLPSAPNLLSPIRHPKRSMERHRIALARMVEMGFLSIEDAEKAYLDFWPDYLSYINDLPPSMNTWSSRIDKAPWFTEFVRRQLIDKYGEKAVYEKGLLVYTTLDLEKQEAAQKILKPALEKQTGVSKSLAFKNEDYIIDNYSDNIEILSLLFDVNPFLKKGSRENKKINDFLQENIISELEGINYLIGFSNIDRLLDKYKEEYFNDKDFQQVEGCLISIDHRNGYIEALMGGSEFTPINQLNRVMQSRRQPGSAIKPLLYSSAIESGKFTPATAILDSPVVYLDNEGGDWIPENYEGEYYGLVRLRRALAMSINVVSIRIAETLGIEYIMDYMAKLLKLDKKTFKSRIPRNFSIALGSFEVSPFELARAYAVIANGGQDVIPFSIRYVINREGEVLENREKEVAEILKEERQKGTLQIIKPETAQVMISLLRSVITSGTGGGASIGRPAAGKTGTTNNWKDGWFVGFVPQLTTCIWFGYDKLGLSLGIGQAGGAVVAPVWSRYMRLALQNVKAAEFPTYAKLAHLQVCAHTGLLPSSSCKEVVDEYFVPGNVPLAECDVCKDIQYSVELAKKGPRENISKEQKKSILSRVNKKKSDGESILNNIGNDILE